KSASGSLPVSRSALAARARSASATPRTVPSSNPPWSGFTSLYPRKKGRLAWRGGKPGPSGFRVGQTILLEPVHRDLTQRLGAEFIPIFFHSTPVNQILEIPERAPAMNGGKQLVAQHFVFDRAGKFFHDLPLMDIEL